MSWAATRLGEAARRFRRSMDVGALGKGEVTRRMRAWGHALLRDHPLDQELWHAFEILRRRRFVPPPEPTLPHGSAEHVAIQLDGWSMDELEAAAAAIVTLPNPTGSPESARTTLQLLLRCPGARTRAEELIEAWTPVAAPEDVALWRLRLALGDRARLSTLDDAGWDALLEPCRALGQAAPRALAAAARRLAAAYLDAKVDRDRIPHVVTALGGQRSVNLALSRRLNPALDQALTRPLGWLAEADALGRDGRPPGLGALVDRAERADAKGDVDHATALLQDVWRQLGERADLAEALEARAWLLHDPSLLADLDATPETIEAVGALSRRRLPPLAPPGHDLPRADWSERVLPQAIAGPTASDDPGVLRIFEEAGAIERAARGWLTLATAGGDLEATRLRAGLPAEAREALATSLARRVEDEHGGDLARPEALDAAVALHALCDDPGERRILGLRIAAALPPDDAATEAPPAMPEDDPHHPHNRVVAAADLMASGRQDAAASVLVALMRKAERAPWLAHLVDVTLTLLRLEHPPADVVLAAERHIRQEDVAGIALIERFSDDPGAAYSVYRTLYAVGGDVARSDRVRVKALRAWLAIWAATRTPPALEDVAPFVTADRLLLPLAAAQLAATADPIAAATAFCAAHPADVSLEVYADDLLGLAVTTTNS